MQTREQNIKLIRAKCIEALCAHGTRSEQARYKMSFDRPIRLADVLLAIVKSPAHGKFANAGDFFDQMVEADFLKVTRMYDFRKDDLTEQSDECILFLSKLFA